MAEGGESYQSELPRQTGFSKSRISEVLSSLEEKGLISRTSLGKNFRIRFANIGEKAGAKSCKSNEKGKSNDQILKLGLIRASEYPFVIPFEKVLRERLGVRLRFILYDNGIDLSRDLSLLRLDLGIAPTLTHFVFYSIGSPIKMIAPAGSGGAAILAKKSSSISPDRREFSVGTTKLSTMELMLRSYMKDGEIPKSSSVKYFSSARQMIDAASLGQVDAACIWEPYSSMLLKKRGFKRLLRYGDDEEEGETCCAVAAGNHLELDTLNRLATIFGEALESYQRNPDRYLAPYAALMRYDEKLMRVASREYAYPQRLDPNKLSKQFERAGIEIPLPSSVKGAVLQ